MLGSNRYLQISIELIAGMFEDGNVIHLKVSPGVPKDAVLVDSYFDHPMQQLVLVFDREVPQIGLTQVMTRKHECECSCKSPG